MLFKYNSDLCDMFLSPHLIVKKLTTTVFTPLSKYFEEATLAVITAVSFSV
jgi:hypothetical protein